MKPGCANWSATSPRSTVRSSWQRAPTFPTRRRIPFCRSPPPRQQEQRYHGVFAGRAALRRAVTALVLGASHTLAQDALKIGYVNSERVLRDFHRLGIRYLTLAHFANNAFADSMTDILASRLYATQRVNVEHLKGQAFADRLAQAQARKTQRNK